MRFSSSAGVGFTEYDRFHRVESGAKSGLIALQVGMPWPGADHVAFNRVHARPTLRATLIGVTAIPG